MSSPRIPKLPAPLSRQHQPAPASTPVPIAPGSPYFKRRSFIYAAGFAVITIAGTLIGATLKSSQQAEEKVMRRKKVELDADEQVAVLESTRSSLVMRRVQIERKMQELRERKVKEEELGREREALRAKGEEMKREMKLERRG